MTQARRCTKSTGKGRLINRLAEEELRQECRRRSGRKEGRLLRLTRKSQVERVFADWKEHRGQTRICGRSEAGVEAQLRLTQLYFNARSTFTRSRH